MCVNIYSDLWWCMLFIFLTDSSSDDLLILYHMKVGRMIYVSALSLPRLFKNKYVQIQVQVLTVTVLTVNSDT